MALSSDTEVQAIHCNLRMELELELDVLFLHSRNAGAFGEAVCEGYQELVRRAPFFED